MATEPQQTLLKVYQAALHAVHGRRCVNESLKRYPCHAPVYLIALGKAACAMAQGARDTFGTGIADALIVTKPGFVESLPWPVLEAGHPLPDERSLVAGQTLLDFAARIPSGASVLVLLSGGASALVEVLPQGVTLESLHALNDWLLASGLDITACNQIRKRCSQIKGGRLTEHFAPRPVRCLAISDVPGDDPRSIGSGPLTADPELALPANLSGFPEFVRDALRHSPPAPRAGDICFQNVRIEIIAGLGAAKRAVAEAARELGYGVKLHPEFIEGDALEAGGRLAQILLTAPAGEMQIWGGETTLKLPSLVGHGGRNQSLALSAARVLAGEENVWFLSIGTDGNDGPTLDAGALVDGGTIARGELEGLNVAQALAAADAGTFLEASGDLIQTGPTGTNVMDLMLGLRT